ncbi:MAG TPA: isocitrate lyase/phosphoenolpyruvate mutase family protein [Burkholderiaceae bacterium]
MEHGLQPPISSLRQLLAEPRALLAPGVYDALTALVAQQAGARALYLSGASVAYNRLGRSDVGLTTATEVADTIASIRDRVDTPLIVDADTGFGNALNVRRTVRSFERAGASMIQLEDQDFPKRCGHLAGKSLVSQAEMVGKLHAALDARHDSGTMVLARTDAVAVEGLERALERAEAYLEAGADALFIEALRDDAQMQTACTRFAARVPMLANMVEGGLSPICNTEELYAKGFRIVIFPGGTSRFVVRQLQDYFATLLAQGSTQSMRERMLSFEALNGVIGTPELLALGERYRAQ